MKIAYFGSWPDHSGYGEANRNFIYALYKAGVDVVTQRMSYVKETTDYGELLGICDKLCTGKDDYQVRILHITPDQYFHHIEPGKYHIGHLFWETDRIPAIWAWNCNRMDEIWTGSEANKKALITSGVRVPIHIFPQPVYFQERIYDPFIITAHSGYFFYSIFEWTERKNPEALLRAFYTEFNGCSDVSLLIKSFRDGYGLQKRQYVVDQLKQIKEEYGSKASPKVFFCGELLTNSDMFRLHATGDCFVSTHCGEGWGRPQTEAMVMGRPIISTNAGGIHEYLNNKVAMLIDGKVVPVTEDPERQWYTKDQNWVEIDELELRKKMRWAYDHQDLARKMGQEGKQFVLNEFDPEKIGLLMKKRLDEIEPLIR